MACDVAEVCAKVSAMGAVSTKASVSVKACAKVSAKVSAIGAVSVSARVNAIGAASVSAQPRTPAHDRPQHMRANRANPLARHQISH